MRRNLTVGIGVLTGLLVLVLYLLVFLMTGEHDSVVLGRAADAPEIHFSNLAFLILLVIPICFGVTWLLAAPDKLVDAGKRRAKDKGLAALEDALVAVASGDGRAARLAAGKAADLLKRPVAPRLISAQAAEQMGDLVGAESQYAAMLADPRTALVGRRGLSAAALERGDYETAILHAAQAFVSDAGVRWAFDLLFDAQVRSARWDEALETLDQGARRKHVGEAAARRRRAVLLAASAAALERKDSQTARDRAVQSAQLSPAFAPGAALAARLLLAAGKGWRAAGLLEDAWAAAPHPALALAYRDLKPDEGDAARIRRLRGLAEMNPEHRESRILMAEQALESGDGRAAAAALEPVLIDEVPPSGRLCGLMAHAAQAQGDGAGARAWVDRAAGAPEEADWSDLDPEGPAFAYTDADWSRLVYSFGDTGQLIHPRHERFERRVAVTPKALLTAQSQIAAEDAAAPAAPADADQIAAPDETAPSPPPRPDA